MAPATLTDRIRRAARVIDMLLDANVYLTYLRLSQATGTPEHPLYLPASLVPIPYDAEVNT